MCNGQSKLAASAAQTHQCACGGHESPQHGRRVEASHDLDFPPVTFPSSRMIGDVGEAKLREVVRRHHELLRSSAIAGMFASDDAEFAALVERVGDFVVESCGGPATFSAQNGTTCMRTRHFPFSIDESAREVWLDLLFQAMVDTGFPEMAREDYWNWLEAMSIRMINRRTSKAQAVRVSFAVAQRRFDETAGEGLPCGVGMRICPHG